MGIFIKLLLGLFITAIAYLGFPIIKLIIGAGKFPKKQAQKIALWNSIIVGAIFCILTIELSNGNTTWNAHLRFYIILLTVLSLLIRIQKAMN